MTLAVGVVALAVGIVVGHLRGPGTGAAAVLVAACAGAGAWALRRWLRPASIVLASLMAFAGGSALMQRAEHGLVDSPVRALARTRALAEVRATLVEDPQMRPQSARVLARIETITRRDGQRVFGGRRRVEVQASGAGAMRLGILQAGDHITIDGAFGELGTRTRWLWSQHVGAAFRMRTLLAMRPPGPGGMALANAARNRVLAGVASMPMPQRALAAGFLLGDTSALSATDVARYRASGLSHLLAVSGANLAFVVACVGPLLRRMNRTGRCIGAAVVIVGFVVMTRGEPSILRAAAMALLALLAQYAGRPVAATRLLLLGTGVLLVIDPFLLFRTGFQLSVGATLGLVVASQPIARCLVGPPVVREALATPLAAQLGVAPVALSTFGAMPLVAIPANVIAAPLAGPITIIGLVAALAGGLLRDWWPALAGALQYPTVWCISCVQAVAITAARIPVAIDRRGALLLVGIAVVASCVRPGILRRLAAGPARSGR